MANQENNKLDKALNNSNKHRILFICLGNICRSPAAEGIMRRVVEEHGDSDNWVIDSAGIGGWHVGDLPDRRMRVAARRRGLDLDHICRQIKPLDFSKFDMVIGMDDSNIDDLRALAPSPEAEKKIHRMSEFFPKGTVIDHVPDPYYSGYDGFELVLDLLGDACENLYKACES